ncbi:ComEC/Rec2 family competence protein [Microbacterium sp.]|uniref:ComEC/Rec2 family competence protein n=1 Tax=Microbacterium sp. TaxID=51671 RepID=UPI002627C5AF|nr:ComEC/Rec2 family competence protein [Microbacterium sp.]
MSTPRVRDLRLVPLAAIVWVTALGCVFFPLVSWWCVLAGLGGAAVALGVLLHDRARGRARGGGLLVLLALAAAAAAMTAALAVPQREAAAEWDGQSVEVVGEIASSASTGSDGRIWFDVNTHTVGDADSPEQLAVPIRIGSERIDGLELGAVIRAGGRALVTDPGERAALVLFGDDIQVVTPAEGVFGVAAQMRADFVERAVALPEPGAGLLPGLAVGDTRAVSEELNAAMLSSGLSHLTAVSGANCAIVVGAVFWLVALCGGGRMTRIVLALAALAGFVVLVTPEPSVIRAATMAGLVMLTLMCGRPSAGVGVLCLAVVGILIADPWLAATAGFALSAAATAALIVLGPPLARGLGRWMPQPLALALAIPLAAHLVCGPIIVLFAEQQSIIGVAANILAAPAAPIATVVGLLACLTAPIPMLADLLAASAWLPAAWISTTATVTAALPGAAVLVVPGIITALIIAGLSAAIGIVLCGSAGSWGRRLHSASLVVLIVAVALTGARMLLGGPLAAMRVPEGWSVAACDVGQGDALLVRSEGQIALIDTGIDPALLRACLDALAIGRIDLLVLTHFDADHVGAASVVIGRVETVLHGPTGSAADAQLLDELAGAGAQLVSASTGMRGQLGGASWQVLWPRERSAAFPEGNDASIVVEFAGGGVPRSLFLGDLSATPQRMLSTQLHGVYPVVKVSHHGSADQDPGLYAAVRPAVAIVSAGSGNDYGHPRAETLDLLEAVGARALRTDLQGRILIGLAGDELQVWTERSGAGENAADVDDPG